ncbi:Eco57I restriction-modification methylase domain-containing protein [Nocardiopsis baichengensis]|uniref:Eco57I restriction-modification methylase domain-containing protein n=1 Tax=Nocardiopsis baichengensis TaxID=280240 RepID=UPI00034C30D5|nr:DNA methyltransferase [Nocardiopsis baichengensis]
MSAPTTAARRRRTTGEDSAEQHRNWLSLIEVDGPFLTLPVLRATWPARLDPLDKEERARLRREHARWQAASATTAGQEAWIRYLLADMLAWGDDLHLAARSPEEGAEGNGAERVGAASASDGDTGEDGGGDTDAAALDALALEVPEHETRVVPSFVLTAPGEAVKPDTVRVLGLVCPPGQQPTARIKGEAWAASPADRVAQLCRHHGVELGLATDGRWWALVWAPRGGVTTTAVFDTAVWNERAERDVVEAFHSLLCRRRFFGVPDEETLVRLLAKSQDGQEEITEALGVQVRQAVELLVAAFGRADTKLRERGEPDLSEVEAHEVYRGAVSVMMRVVFLLFAEERGLLPSDNDLYLKSYSAGRLCAELEQRALEGSEDELEETYTAWHRLLALFEAVYRGVDHPRLRMHPHDGSLFNPDEFPWMPLLIDDRTVLHMLRSVQYVVVGKGKSKERRALSFRSLDVEQIGYVYEGLLSFDGYRAESETVGLTGKVGAEEEVELRRLEEMAAQCADVPALAAKLAAEFKDSGIGSARALEKKLTPLSGVEKEEARKKVQAAVGNDQALVERLMPFYGVLREDLRGLPFVVLPGELYVTESSLRKNTGTHYTPRFLAEEVVEGALEPLVYEPGPLQTANKDEWKLKSSREILDLKVADIAMGSAAFLVAAARYLGDKLLEAWTNEGDERVRDYTPGSDGASADEDPVVIEARRQIIEHCLYGVDINPMAVEMAKLSLWLVSMAPERPFTFLDDRLAAGDSLLGITSLEQLEYMHMDPRQGRKIHERGIVDFTAGARELVSRVAERRREIAEVDGSTLEGLSRKRKLLADAELEVTRAHLLADLTVGSALVSAGRGDREQREATLTAADLARRLNKAEPEAKQQASEWLRTHKPGHTFKRSPLHWPLRFPEVSTSGGFDAIIGNPPFLGGKKIAGTLGRDYRENLIKYTGGAVRGNADLVAYFFLRADTLISKSGTSGLIATNTVSQGDTREVSLDQIIDNGTVIYKAVKSSPWPSKSAALEYSAVWFTHTRLGDVAKRCIDDTAVAEIASTLTPAARTRGTPRKLHLNKNRAFIGSYVLGTGFIISHEDARFLVSEDRKNLEVVFPYLNGEDLNNRPDLSASRSIINFHNWQEEEAKAYTKPFSIIETNVKPERQRITEDGSFKLRSPLPQKYWQYADKRPGLYRELSHLAWTIALTIVSKVMIPVKVPTGQVFAHRLAIFASDDDAFLATLSSAIHFWWSSRYTSTLETRINYSPSDVFETFPLPELTQELRDLGERLDSYRRDVMLSRDSGLTKTYNLVFDPDCNDDDIVELRRIHREIDEATIRAYGWEERIEAVGGLDHGFHKVGGRETRYTIGPAAQREVLDSLLELNHERYAEEVAQGLHDKKKTGKSKKKAADDEGTLF